MRVAVLLHFVATPARIANPRLRSLPAAYWLSENSKAHAARSCCGQLLRLCRCAGASTPAVQLSGQRGRMLRTMQLRRCDTTQLQAPGRHNRSYYVAPWAGHTRAHKYCDSYPVCGAQRGSAADSRSTQAWQTSFARRATEQSSSLIMFHNGVMNSIRFWSSSHLWSSPWHALRVRVCMRGAALAACPGGRLHAAVVDISRHDEQLHASTVRARRELSAATPGPRPLPRALDRCRNSRARLTWRAYVRQLRSGSPAVAVDLCIKI